jgi:hypothetical protein
VLLRSLKGRLMTDNPYAPPKATVADVSPEGEARIRPREIALVLKLAAAGYVFGLVAIALSWDYYSKLMTPAGLVVNQVFSLALAAWFYYKIYMGRNWARWVLLVSSVLGSILVFSRIFLEIVYSAPPLAKFSMVVGLVINLSILWLLFVSPGREWFTRGKLPVVA